MGRFLVSNYVERWPRAHPKCPHRRAHRKKSRKDGLKPDHNARKQKTRLSSWREIIGLGAYLLHGVGSIGVLGVSWGRCNARYRFSL